MDGQAPDEGRRTQISRNVVIIKSKMMHRPNIRNINKRICFYLIRNISVSFSIFLKGKINDKISKYLWRNMYTKYKSTYPPPFSRGRQECCGVFCYYVVAYTDIGFSSANAKLNGRSEIILTQLVYFSFLSFMHSLVANATHRMKC